MKKIEKGVMVIKDGRAWTSHPDPLDSRCHYSGWTDLEHGDISDPRFCKKTTDVTYENSPYTEELLQAHLACVERTTEIEVKIIPWHEAKHEDSDLH